jgi:hypothetical protein
MITNVYCTIIESAKVTYSGKLGKNQHFCQPPVSNKILTTQRVGLNITNKVCGSSDSWVLTDHPQILVMYLQTPLKCSLRALKTLINNLSIVYHQYCSSSYLDYCRFPTLLLAGKWKSSLNWTQKKVYKATVAIAASYGLG